MKTRNTEPSQRQLRVGEMLRHGLVKILAKDEIQDPAVQGVSITVNEVTVSRDMRNATAYVMPLGGENTKEVVEGLNRASKFVRGRLSQDIHLKHSPKILFTAETKFDYADKIDTLLKSPDVAGDLSKKSTDQETS